MEDVLFFTEIIQLICDMVVSDIEWFEMHDNPKRIRCCSEYGVLFV